jgi:hypothetical protein
MHILWIILIGFVAGVLAKLVTPGDNEPQGFILTTVLGIVGALPWSGHRVVRPGSKCGTHWSGRGRSTYTVGLGLCCS